MESTEHLLSAVMNATDGESDRGCVLMSASLIEWQLAELLRTKFLLEIEAAEGAVSESVRKQVDVLLDPLNEKSVLGAAAPRARMCRVLGLIDDATHDSLKKFLRFRNHYFAHRLGASTLSDSGLQRELEEFLNGFTTFKSLLGNTETSQRKRFLMAIVVLYFKVSPEKLLIPREILNPSPPHLGPQQMQSEAKQGESQ